MEIVGLSEVRWKDFGEKSLGSGQILLYSGLRGENATHDYGVGFLFSGKSFASLMEWTPVDERIIVARFKSRFRNTTIIQCYAPTEEATAIVKERFYKKLTHTINKIHRKDIVFVMGDMNAQMGSENKNLEKFMGHHLVIV